eukprot:TRINITY_DN26058_c0_g1_i2.p1 TRINITY_DN26058_c0_g1~~TRINITY_DN26058_c0_g1_i2.p1  ORF type:complete len:133 (-),score=28.77 TRINITY_DN26058_c0_g1_i2:343-699(-)
MSARQVNFKRTCANGNDHVFILSSDGCTLEGRCLQHNGKWTLRKVVDSPETTLLQLFAEYDASGDGKISEDELANILMKLDPNLEREEVQTLFKAVDANNDGSLDYEEFVTWITGAKR